MEFSRQEYWSGLPFPSSGDLLDPGIKPRSPALRADSLLSEPTKHTACQILPILQGPRSEVTSSRKAVLASPVQNGRPTTGPSSLPELGMTLLLWNQKDLNMALLLTN